MKILAIETASPPGSIALLDGQEVVQAHTLEDARKTTQHFAIIIEKLLQNASWAPSSIDLVTAHTGPGSFTGLRIGITAAKVFAYAVGAEVVGINTLETLAYQCFPGPATTREVEAVIRDDQASEYFRQMYGNQPERWCDTLTGMDRWRAITNYFTRMRFIAEDGSLELATKESADNAPPGFAPWFTYPRQDDVKVIFGHWAALEGNTGSDRFIGLDTGCVWGGALTMMNLDTGEKIHCDCG